MMWLAVSAVGTAWCLQQFNAQPLLSVPAIAWAAIALLAWSLSGGRAASVVLLAGWTLCRADWLIESRWPPVMAGRDVVIEGLVCDFPRSDAQALRLVFQPDADSMPARIHLSWYDDPPRIRPGERWQLKVRLKPPRGLRNPGGFDFEQWLYQRGIAATGYVRPSGLNRRLPPSALDCPVGRIRGELAQRIERAIAHHPARAYVVGVAVGATHGLDERDWELLRRTGTTHLMAISGLNIAMVAAPFLLAGPWLGRVCGALAGRVHAGVVPALLAAAVYTALAGFAVSTVRALVMLAVAAILALRRRRIGIGELLSAAAIIVLAIDPAAVVSVSFWLSFVAVAWLLLATSSGGERTDLRPGLRWIAAQATGLGRAQFVLGFGLAPLSLAWFGQVSLIAPLTNLVAVPVFSLAVMPLTLLGAAFLVPVPWLGTVLLGLAAEVVAGLLRLLQLAAGMGIAVWQPPAMDPTALLLAVVAALVICWWRPLPLRMVGAMLLVPALAGTAKPGPEFRITVMDVGQGLAVLVETARHALLYDAGPAFGARDAGDSVVVPVLRRAGIRHLDAMVISHHDQDHVGGAATVLRAYPQARLIAGSMGALGARDFRRCESGLAWEWDGVRFEVLSPDPGSPPLSDNDGSCVLQVTARGASLLLPGDIGRRHEDRLATRGRLRPTDLVLAPHHGSRSSSGDALVDATRPRFVVFAAGYLNRWGFPAEVVHRRWAEAGSCALDTAGSGAMVFDAVADGRLQLVRRERDAVAHLWSAPAVTLPPCAAPDGLR